MSCAVEGSQAPHKPYPVNRVKTTLSVVKERVPRSVRYPVRRAVFAGLRPLVRGDDVECPVCEGRFSSFVRGLCPGCGAAGRHRLVVLFLRARTKVFDAPQRVLHFAAEPSLAQRFARVPTLDYVPADINPPRGFERVDATDIQLAPGFDGIITSHVLEHIPDDAAAMREMHRVLKPGGWALVIVPVDGEATYENPSVDGAFERQRHFGQFDHVRVYGRDVLGRLEAAGFDVTEEHYADELGAELTRRHGLNRLDLVHFCVKPG